MSILFTSQMVIGKSFWSFCRGRITMIQSFHSFEISGLYISYSKYIVQKFLMIGSLIQIHKTDKVKFWNYVVTVVVVWSDRVFRHATFLVRWNFCASLWVFMCRRFWWLSKPARSDIFTDAAVTIRLVIPIVVCFVRLGWDFSMYRPQYLFRLVFLFRQLRSWMFFYRRVILPHETKKVFLQVCPKSPQNSPNINWLLINWVEHCSKIKVRCTKMLEISLSRSMQSNFECRFCPQVCQEIMCNFEIYDPPTCELISENQEIS